MHQHEFILREDTIELYKLLKVLRIAQTGGQAKELIRLELVGLNGAPEYQLRKQIKAGDVIQVQDNVITILPPK